MVNAHPLPAEHLDEAALAELQNLLEDEFRDLLETFLDDARLRRSDLAERIVAGVADDIRRSAHSFKGSSLNVGALRLSAFCKQLEDSARLGETAEAPRLLASIGEELGIVERLLRERYL